MKRRIAWCAALFATLALSGTLLAQADIAHAAGEPIATMTALPTIVEGTGGANTLAVEIELDIPAPASVSMTFTTTDGSASSVGGEDFTAQNTSVTFLAGATGPATIFVPITTDGIDEADETFGISLTADSPDVIASQSGTVTIVDDDDPLVLTLGAPATVIEGTGGTNLLAVPVSLSRPAPTSLSATLQTTDGSASSIGGEDFTAQAVSITFLAGAVGPATIFIPITADDLDEADETFTISLTTTEPALTVAGSPATTTILDDDDPLVVTLSASPTVVEGTGGTTTLSALVTLSRPSLTSFTATLQTTDGSASSVGGEDFTAQAVSITFLAGAVGPVTILIPIATDALSESNETFTISLTTAAPNVTVAGSPVTTTIVDDDDVVDPSVTIEQGSGQADPATSAPVVFTVAFDEPVFGFDGSDVTLSGTAGASTATVSGGPQLYTVAVTGMTQPGTVIAMIAAGVATDGHGNPNVASTSVDNTVRFAPSSALPAAMPVTGSEPGDAMLVGATLLALGGAIVAGRRMRTGRLAAR